MAKRVVKVKKGVPKPHKYKGKVRQFQLGHGLPLPHQIAAELAGYRDVLLGRELPPIDKGIITLYEVAEGYFSRACELEQLILEAQREGRISKQSDYQQVRTQEIRSFKEMSKSAAELGSRRVTWESIRFQQEMQGRESI